MSEVDQQYQTQEDVKNRSDNGDVFAPGDKELIRDEKGDDNQTNPCDQLGTPKPVLYSRPLVSCAVDPNEEQGEDKVEETERKIDAMHSDVAVAFGPVAGDGGVIEESMFELLDGPVGQHDPGEDGVEEQYDGVDDTGRHAIVAFSARTADGAACRRSTAACGEGGQAGHAGEREERQAE